MESPTDWWNGFFTGLFADFWRAVIPAEHTLAEVDFLEKVLALAPGSRVLDVPCGHGRHSLELARRGYRVTGLDFSTDLLGSARESARRARPRDRVGRARHARRRGRRGLRRRLLRRKFLRLLRRCRQPGFPRFGRPRPSKGRALRARIRLDQRGPPAELPRQDRHGSRRHRFSGREPRTTPPRRASRAASPCAAARRARPGSPRTGSTPAGRSCGCSKARDSRISRRSDRSPGSPSSWAPRDSFWRRRRARPLWTGERLDQAGDRRLGHRLKLAFAALRRAHRGTSAAGGRSPAA